VSVKERNDTNEDQRRERSLTVSALPLGSPESGEDRKDDEAEASEK
jgi:hypothetical protein